MSAQSSPEEFPNHDEASFDETPARLWDTDLTHLTEPQKRMLSAFEGYCSHQEGTPLDMSTNDAELAPLLSSAAHGFINATVKRSLPKLIERGGAPKNAATFNTEWVEGALGRYYEEFGVERRGNSGVKRQQQEKYIHTRTDGLARELHTGEGIKQVSAFRAYPEVGLALELLGVLTATRHTVAADSVEVLLVAYGERLTTSYGKLGRTAVNPELVAGVKNTHPIKQIDKDSIPEGFAAENYRPKKEKS